MLFRLQYRPRRRRAGLFPSPTATGRVSRLGTVHPRPPAEPTPGLWLRTAPMRGSPRSATRDDRLARGACRARRRAPSRAQRAPSWNPTGSVRGLATFPVTFAGRVDDEPLPADRDVVTLSAIERRVLWLAVRIVDYANRERPKGDALKVGGHQASSASMVTLMTALYLADLGRRPRLGEAARVARAARARVPAGPARPLVPDAAARLRRAAVLPVANEGPVSGRLLDGLGRPRLGGAALRRARRPVLRVPARRSTGGRFISLLGDAELDEGNIWEALAEPLTRRLGNVLWIVDLNRQSLDRVIPGIRAAELEAQFRTERLGRDRAQVRAPAARGVRTRGRRAAAPPHRRDAQRAVPVALRRGEDVVRTTLLDGAGGERARTARAPARRLPGRRRAARPRPRRPRPRRRARRARAGARDRRPADGDLRLHDQGLRPRDRRPPAEPLGPARRRPDRPAPRRDRD